MDTAPGDARVPPLSAPESRVPPLPTRRVLVWDLPTRLLHWVLAGSFTGALLIATLVRHRDPVFPVHMLLGAVAATAVVLRGVWGLVGSRYARFRSFLFGPKAFFAYLKSLITGKGERQVGHNPANAWAAFGMLAGVLGVAATGAMMASGTHGILWLHKTFAYGTLALVAAHLVGIFVHTMRHREGIALGMLDGKKLATSAQAIASGHPIVAFTFLVLLGGGAAGLVHDYDGATRTLNLPGNVTLKLGPGRRADDPGQNGDAPRDPSKKRGRQGPRGKRWGNAEG